MNKSETISKLAAALVVAQPQVKTAIMDSTNPFFKSKYADLGAVWDAVREALESNHLTVTQFPDHVGEAPALTTILMHNSGEWISGTYPLMVTDKESTPQGYGSALTYARRYGLSAVLGVIADEDDDGNAASKREKPAAPKPVSQPDPEVSKPTAQWKIEGLAEAEKGSDQLYLWWRALPKPVQLLLTKYKDETLKPAAERADKVMA